MIQEYRNQELIPNTVGSCTKCENRHQLWCDYEDGICEDPICMPCLVGIDQRFVENELTEVEDTTVEETCVVFEFGFDLVAYWNFDKEKVPKSRDPNETRTTIQPLVKKGGTVLHKGEELCTIENSYYREKAEELASERL